MAHVAWSHVEALSVWMRRVPNGLGDLRAGMMMRDEVEGTRTCLEAARRKFIEFGGRQERTKPRQLALAFGHDWNFSRFDDNQRLKVLAKLRISFTSPSKPRRISARFRATSNF